VAGLAVPEYALFGLAVGILALGMCVGVVGLVWSRENVGPGDKVLTPDWGDWYRYHLARADTCIFQECSIRRGHSK